MAIHWSLGFAGFIQFQSHAYSPHFDSFQLIPFFFYIHIPNFLYSPYLIPFILFPIHFYSSSDPPYSESTPHSTPYLGLAEAGSAIPKSSNRWDSELKTRRSQDWMQQFRVCLGFRFHHISILFFHFLHGFSIFLLAVCFVVFRRSFSSYLQCIYTVGLLADVVTCHKGHLD